jgi:2-oxoglutarate ferredoxin oxidoreductase subunit alpha
MLRLITIWPFPEQIIRRLAKRVKGFVTVEINLGQIHLEVERCAGGNAQALLAGHPGGTIIPPEDVVTLLKEASQI